MKHKTLLSLLLVVPFVVGLYTCSYLVSPDKTEYPLPEIETSSGLEQEATGGQ